MNDLKKMTFAQLAEVVESVWLEVKRRNPIGVNFYYFPFSSASKNLREIGKAEKDNPTCEAGPGIDKPKKLKYELCDTVFPSGEKCVRPKNHHEWSKAKCSPTVKFMEYPADTQCEEAHLRVLENKAIRKLLEAGPELEKAKKKYKMHWSKLAGDAYCGGSLRMETTRDKRNVSCLTCRKLMKLHGHLEDV